MPTTYYKVHGGRLSVAEYWRMCPDPFTFLIATGMKLFGGLPMTFSIPRVDRLHTVPWEHLRAECRERLDDPVGRLEDGGLARQFCYQLPLLEAHRYGAGVVLLAADRKAFANVVFFRDRDQRQLAVSCVSRFPDDSLRGVTTEKKTMKPNPRYVVERYPGMAADDLFDRHRDHLAGWEADAGPADAISPAALPDIILGVEQEYVDFHVDRGVFVPMTAAEIRQLKEDAEFADADD